MLETVFTAALPVGESLTVQKNRITGLLRGGPRIALVTGMYGDELAGQFVAYELTRRLNECRGDLRGIVDIYPALNALGLSSNEHGVPRFDIDLERTFPGNANGNLTEALADAVYRDILGANVCLVVHSSNARVQEVMQVQIDEQDAGSLAKLALCLNTRLVWMRTSDASQRSTLSRTLNDQGTPTLVVEMGSGSHIDENEGMWLVEGILCLLEQLKAWTGTTITLPQPSVSNGSNVVSLSADCPGLFLPRVQHGSLVKRGDTIGVIVDSLEGMTKCEVCAPCNGLLFSLRTYPVVFAGSLLARVLKEES